MPFTASEIAAYTGISADVEQGWVHVSDDDVGAFEKFTSLNFNAT